MDTPLMSWVTLTCLGSWQRCVRVSHTVLSVKHDGIVVQCQSDSTSFVLRWRDRLCSLYCTECCTEPRRLLDCRDVAHQADYCHQTTVDNVYYSTSARRVWLADELISWWYACLKVLLLTWWHYPLYTVCANVTYRWLTAQRCYVHFWWNRDLDTQW